MLSWPVGVPLPPGAENRPAGRARRRAYGALRLTVLIATVGSGCEVSINEEPTFTGEKKGVAEVADEYEQSLSEGRFEEVCGELFTPRYREEIGTNASSYVPCEQLLERGDEISVFVSEVTLYGDEATMTVFEDGTEMRWSMEKQDGQWRIDSQEEVR